MTHSPYSVVCDPMRWQMANDNQKTGLGDGKTRRLAVRKVQQLSRHCHSILPIFAIALAFWGNFAPAWTNVAVPELDLREVSDAEVTAALRAGYNLPELRRSYSARGEMLAEQWAAKVKDERRRLAEIMKYFGYLDGEVRFKGGLTPVPGPLYRIGVVELEGIEGRGVEPRIVEDLASVLASIPGSVARSDTISQLEKEILFRVGAGPYPLARFTSRSLVLDQETHTATVRLVIDIGNPARFGAVRFRGLKRIDPQILMSFVPFSPGDPFDRSELAALRKNLEKRGLFSSFRVKYAEAPDETGLLPIQVTLQEIPPDNERLARSGFAGLVVTAAALSLLALRQVALARRSSAGIKRGVEVVLFLLVPAAAMLAALRAVDFLQGY